MSEFCSTCRFFLAEGDEGGRCRRHAPQASIWTDTNYGDAPIYNSTFEWPPVANGQWCGDHERVTR